MREKPERSALRISVLNALLLHVVDVAVVGGGRLLFVAQFLVHPPEVIQRDSILDVAYGVSAPKALHCFLVNRTKKS